MLSFHRTSHLAALLTALALASSCGSISEVAGESDTHTATTVDVVAEFSILADFAEAVGGDRVRVTTLVPLGGDPHVHEPRPDDARRVADADLVLEHGLGLSPWMNSLTQNANGHVITVAESVVDHAVVDDHGEVDPHLWMAPPHAAQYVLTIRDALVRLDAASRDDYHRNAEAYLRQLDAVDEDLRATFVAVPHDRRLLVTPHDAYRYFAAHFELEVLGTLVGITSEEEPSAQRMREVVDAVRRTEVPAVFIESTVPPRQIERVASEAGVEVAGPLYGDSVGEPGSDASDYLGMMRWNAEVIVDALGESP